MDLLPQNPYRMSVLSMATAMGLVPMIWTVGAVLFLITQQSLVWVLIYIVGSGLIWLVSTMAIYGGMMLTSDYQIRIETDQGGIENDQTKDEVED